MKKITRIISVLLAVVLVAGIVTVAPFSVSAAESGSFGSFSWTLDNGTLTISGTGSMDSAAPYGIWDAPWGTGVKKVVINSGATDIAHQAFMDCAELTSVTIPSTVTKVCDLAFYGCESLNNVNISKVTKIGNQAFQGCLSLSNITFSNNLCDVKMYALDSTAWLSNQSGLVYAGGAFYTCKGECPADLVLRDGTKGIAARALYNDSNIESLTVPEGVTVVGANALYYSSVESVTLPSTLKTIYEEAFKANNLYEVHISDLAAWCSISYVTNAGSSNAGSPFYSRAYLHLNGRTLYDMTIPDGVTRINPYSFKKCSVESVIIPDSVTSVGKQAFYDCGILRGVRIPASVTSIASDAFADCRSDLVIYGYPDSAAQRYAASNSYKFVDVTQKQLYTDEQTGVSALTVIPDGWHLYVDDVGPGFDMITVPDGERIAHNYIVSVDDENNYCKTHLVGTEIRIPFNDPATKIYTYDFYNEEAVPVPFTVRDGMMVVDNVMFYGDNQFFILALPIIDEELEPVGEITASGKTGKLNWKMYANGLLVISGKGDMLPDYDYPNNAPWENFDVIQVNIENGVTSIGNHAFSYHGGLSRVNIADTVTIIGDSAFSNDLALRYVNHGDNIAYVGEDAFSRVPWYSSLSGEGDIIYIGKCAYDYVGDGSSPAVIKDGTMSIGPSAFADSSVETVVLPDTITVIGDGAFSWSNLSSINIPASVKTIGDYAFSICKSLATVTIPAGVTEIGKCAFRCCKSLTAIRVNSANKNYSAVSGVLFNKDKTVLLQYPCGKTYKNYTMPATVTEIADDAFADCENIENVNANEGLVTIGNYAFDECYNLKSFNMPSTVTTIKEEAFSECESLDNITLPDGLTTLEYGAFSSCGSLSLIKIPESITELEGAVFYYCSLTTVKLPSKLTKIGPQAFQGCDLTSISIPSTVIEIGKEAFRDCTSLRSIYTDCCPKKIGYDAFDNTPWLTNSNTGIINLGRCAYTCYKSYPSSCEVTLRADIKRVNDKAFWAEPVTKINLSDCLENIGRLAFFGTKLNEVTIPLSVNHIGEYAFGFRGNSSNPTKIDGFTIYGYTGSVAEIYAEKYGFTFVSIGTAPFIKHMGDANMDGVSNVKDVTAIQRYVSEFEPLTDEQLALADVDGDGAVTIEDATLLQMYLAEYDVTFE